MKSARGNALFLILIAVALFAALSYAVTQSGRGSGTISKEQASLNAAALFNYVADLRTAAARLKLSGCTTAELSFDVPPYNTDYYNSNAPADRFCHFFAPEGAGIVYKTAQELKGDLVLLTSDILLSPPGKPGVTLTLSNITKAECIAINKSVNYNPPTFAPAALTLSSPYVTLFKGSFSSTIAFTNLSGQQSACFQGTGAYNPYYFGAGAVYWYYANILN